jgi:hypothetical protein
MPGKTSFYHAIFKKLQAASGSQSLYLTGDHFADDESFDLAGGFSLRSTDNKYGIFGQLSHNANTYPQYPGLTPGWFPLTPGELDPAKNPLWALLNASLGAPPLPNTVPVNGQDWPVMPQPDFVNHTIDQYKDWKEFNTAPHRVIDAMADWITAGKLDDTPKSWPLTWTDMIQHPPSPFGFAKTSDAYPILFVSSKFGDDGRRPGDGGVPAVPANHIPDKFWNTSRIYLTDENGKTVYPQHLQPGEEYYVAAMIGNAGNMTAGRVAGNDKILVVAEAQVFNSGFGPATSLPALSNLNPASTYGVYEQYGLGQVRFDVVGFRFNVDAVIAALKQEITAQISTGGLTPEQWLNDSHPCIKVLITGGEPIGGPYSPAANAPPTFNSNPRTERHVAQRNLAPFLIPMAGAKKIGWMKFICGQIGPGTNQLAIDHRLSPNVYRFYLAMPTAIYERYVAKGRHAGFEVVRDVEKPFPDAVMLRQTARGARLGIANHERELFFGMALGIDWQPRGLRPGPAGEASLIHHRDDGSAGGGFTLQVQVEGGR